MPVYVSRLSNQVHHRSNIFSDSSIGYLFNAILSQRNNLRFSYASEITEIADKLRWLRYQKGLRQRDVADYAGIDRSTYVHYEEYGKDLYPPEHMEKIAQLFEVPVETLLDMNLVGPNSARNI